MPEPTEVRPTTKPPVAPSAIAASLSLRCRMNGASLEWPWMNVLIRKPSPPTISATPTTRWSCVASRCGGRPGRRRATSGAEPASIHSASRACTVPSMRCRAAPNDLKIAPWRMSVPTATFGVEVEEQDQDRRHQRAAAHAGHADEDADEQARERELPGHVLFGRVTFGSCASGIGHETNGLPGDPAEELVRLAARAEAGGGSEQRERRDEQAERGAEDRRAERVRDRGGGEHGEPDDVRGARRPRVLELALAEARLDELEVGEARQAPAAAERQPERELEREQRAAGTTSRSRRR